MSVPFTFICVRSTTGVYLGVTAPEVNNIGNSFGINIFFARGPETPPLPPGCRPGPCRRGGRPRPSRKGAVFYLT